MLRAVGHLCFWESGLVAGVNNGMLSSQVLGLYDGSLDDVDGIVDSSVSSGHLHVHLSNGSADADVSVLLVHVVDSGSGPVSDHEPVVPDCGWVLLENFADGQHLAVGSLDSALLFEEVPELGLGKDGVFSEDSHFENLWFWVVFGWEHSSGNQKLLNLNRSKLET